MTEREGWRIVTPRHAPHPTLEGHLTFALKYDGLDLAVLKRLFIAAGPAAIEALVRAKPTGSYARRLWFLYEWLTGDRLDLPDATAGRYVPVVDPDQQYAPKGENAPRYRVRNNLPGTLSSDTQVLADALRTDPRGFRRLQPLDPRVVALRESSRLLEDLRGDRNRLANRVRELLWRYFPAMLELDDDVAAPWFLDLWQRVPTPAKAARVRATTIERLLKRHRIRRLDADRVLDRLRQPAVATAAGTVDAATAHLRVVVERLRLVNRQIKSQLLHRKAPRSAHRAARHRGERHRDDAA